MTRPTLVLAAHGDRGDRERNRWLLDHAAALDRTGRYGGVEAGVLKGEPSLEATMARASADPDCPILVYPLFMSDGYFMRVLRERLSAAAPMDRTTVLAPLGADPRLPPLMLQRALDAAAAAGFDLPESRLLVVAHGSKFGPANRRAAERLCAVLAPMSSFARVEDAYLEEAPFLREALARPEPTVAAGFFSGEGMHAQGDVPAAIAEAGARAIYTGAVGADPAIRDLILAAAVPAPPTAA